MELEDRPRRGTRRQGRRFPGLEDVAGARAEGRVVNAALRVRAHAHAGHADRGHADVPGGAGRQPDWQRRRDAGARPGRTGWGEFLERVRASIGSFVVISDGYNQDLASSLQKNGGHLLSRPVEEGPLDRILGEIGEQPKA